MIKRTTALALLLGGAGLAMASPPKNPWQAFSEPAPGQARAIGDYSGGCVQGAQPLQLDGPGFQVMHPSRKRYFGHPDLLAFIRSLGAAFSAQGHGVLLIGDLSQPRGGRASGGHASHQTGLDVDIWFWAPKQAEQGPLSTAQREQLKARSILNGKTSSVRARWKARVASALRLTAEDARVERVFVNPIIKRELCADDEPSARAWLRKIRPWYGHDDHFHVRLACPSDSPHCEPQQAVSAGDGCDEVDWWFSEEARADREQGRSRYRSKVVSGPRWPEACNALLD